MDVIFDKHSIVYEEILLEDESIQHSSNYYSMLKFQRFVLFKRRIRSPIMKFSKLSLKYLKSAYHNILNINILCILLL